MQNLDYNTLLGEVGRPINKAAKQNVIESGDPIYFITNNSLHHIYPELLSLAKNEYDLENTWIEVIDELMLFYSNSNFLSNTPIWLIDEKKLSIKREQIVSRYIQENDKLLICYLDRYINKNANYVQIQANRGLVLNSKHIISRQDTFHILVERPGTPNLTAQINKIKEYYVQTEAKGIVLVDGGIASGNSIYNLKQQLFQDHGMQVIKFFGGVGWYPNGFERIKELDPECIFWFDLSKGGWIESRDFFLLPNTGIPIANFDRLYREPFNDSEIGFSIPYISFSERWFRIANVLEVKNIIQLCFDLTLKLYHALQSELPLIEIQRAYEVRNKLFQLPVHFGNLDTQMSTLTQDMDIRDYIKGYFFKLNI